MMRAGTDRAETYGEFFEFDIQCVMNEGWGLSRRELFKWWLGEGTTFCCRNCEEEFTPKGNVEEDDEILCDRCRKEK